MSTATPEQERAFTAAGMVAPDAVNPALRSAVLNARSAVTQQAADAIGTTSPIAPCICHQSGADNRGDLDRLRAFIAAGYDQYEASLWLWAGKPMPVRAWVRDQFRQAFPWLVLPAEVEVVP